MIIGLAPEAFSRDTQPNEVKDYIRTLKNLQKILSSVMDVIVLKIHLYYQTLSQCSS